MIASRPLVSVLIPCYNSLKTIDNTIKSVLDQSYNHLEIIINDDCSTDGTYQYLVENYGHLSFLKINRNEVNLGMCANWNKLFSLANGEYWLKLDADDILKKEFLEITVVAATTHKSDFTGTSYNFLDVIKNETSPVITHINRKDGMISDPISDIFINYPFHLCFTLLRADFVKKISPQYYFVNTEVGDAEFQIRAALNNEFKAYFINKQLGFYCFHGNNSSLTPLKQAKSFLYDVIGIHHAELQEKLKGLFNHKMKDNFKLHLKEMLLRRTPWDFKLLTTYFKYAWFN